MEPIIVMCFAAYNTSGLDSVDFICHQERSQRTGPTGYVYAIGLLFSH